MVQRTVISDPLEFARRGEHLSGEVALAQLPRLADLLAGPEGVLRFTVAGEALDQDRYLALTLVAEPLLQCQRCLQPMAWPVHLSARLQLVAPGQPMPDDALEDDASDPIVAERDLDVLGLLEEELLLGLPLAPRHDACETPLESGAKNRASPFAVLSALRNKE